ncbi:unnamed protein product [Bubo scandiacus]
MAAEPGPGPDPELEELLDSALDDFEKARPAAPPPPPPPPRGSALAQRRRQGLALRRAGAVLPGAVRGGLGLTGGRRVRAGDAGAGAGGAAPGGAVPEAVGGRGQSGQRRGVAAGVHLLPEGDAERPWPGTPPTCRAPRPRRRSWRRRWRGWGWRRARARAASCPSCAASCRASSPGTCSTPRSRRSPRSTPSGCGGTAPRCRPSSTSGPSSTSCSSCRTWGHPPKELAGESPPGFNLDLPAAGEQCRLM